MTLDRSLALDELADHFYDYLPGKPHPMADARISFAGAAQELGLSTYWTGGSKRPAIRHLLGAVADGKAGSFTKLIIKIVERSITYRKRHNPLAREDVDTLNLLLARLGYKIVELHDPAFLDRLPRRDATAAAMAHGRVDAKQLAAINQRLLDLTKTPAQQRGYAFEGLLTDLFALYSLAPRGSFRVVGEQIDGSFVLHGDPYLLEAKWQDGRTSGADLLTFAGKVTGKAEWARGLFVSYSGFTDEGLEAFRRGKRTSILCMDGLDVAHILSGCLDLIEVIDAKARRAAETNCAFVPVRDLFASVI